MDNQIKKSIHWELLSNDQTFGGLPANYMSVVESPNEIIGLAAIGSFLVGGLNQNEKCCLLCLETPELVTEKLHSLGYDFSGAIREERLIILSFQPEILHELGMSHDMKSLWQEIVLLCHGSPARLAILSIDSLINTHSSMLMSNSAQKIATISQYLSDSGTTILSQFVHYQSSIYSELSIALQKTMAAYYKISHSDHETFFLECLKNAWFIQSKEKISFKLQQGHGICEITPIKSQSAA